MATGLWNITDYHALCTGLVYQVINSVQGGPTNNGRANQQTGEVAGRGRGEVEKYP